MARGGGAQTAAILLVSILVARYVSPFQSPTLIIAGALLLAFVLASSRQPAGVEQFSPIYTSSIAAGLQYGVAAVQGRRAYMEDMHQIVGFDEDSAADGGGGGVGMTHFFAVFDGVRHSRLATAAWPLRPRARVPVC